MQGSDSCLLPDPSHLAVKAHVAKWRTPFPQQKRIARPGPPSVQLHESLENRNQLPRQRDYPGGRAGDVMNPQLRATMVCRCIGNLQSTKLLGAQAPVKQGQYDNLVHHSPTGSVASGFVRAPLDMCEQRLHLLLGQAGCCSHAVIGRLSGHRVTYKIGRNL